MQFQNLLQAEEDIKKKNLIPVTFVVLELLNNLWGLGTE
jgi:hypothetical protein